jgi:hypothetical protein
MPPRDPASNLVLPALIFPPYHTRITTVDGVARIFDEVRSAYVALTPEEWVRQHCVHWLIDAHGYPKGRCSVERTVGRTEQRYDVVWMDAHVKPFLLVECKAPGVPLTHETVRQSAWYNLTLRAPYLMLTNGQSAIVAAVSDDGSLTRVDDVPTYPRTAS